MDTLETLAQKLQTSDEIQSIVRTMKTLSSVSIRQYETAEAAMSEFSYTIDLGLKAALLDRHARGLALPDVGLNARVARRTAFIIIGSDRGLCGRYNESITQFALDHLEGTGAMIGVMGVRVAARLQTAGYEPDTLFPLPASVNGLKSLVQSVIVELDLWTRLKHVDQVWVLHNRHIGRSTSSPVARPLLPLPDDYWRDLTNSRWPARPIPSFRMSPEALLSWLIRQRLFVVLYRSLTQSLASEHATRLTAMQNAERNIVEQRDSLQASFRRERQASITQELLEIIGGFEAISADSGG